MRYEYPVEVLEEADGFTATVLACLACPPLATRATRLQSELP